MRPDTGCIRSGGRGGVFQGPPSRSAKAACGAMPNGGDRALTFRAPGAGGSRSERGEEGPRGTGSSTFPQASHCRGTRVLRHHALITHEFEARMTRYHNDIKPDNF